MNPCNNKPKNKKVATKQDIPVVQERDDSVITFDDNDESLLKDFNATSFLERRKINELSQDKTYVMEHVERTTTKFGDALIATLHEGDDRFKVILPKRYNSKLTDKHIKYANTNTLCLKYLGGEFNDLEFTKRKVASLQGRGLPVFIG